MVAVAIVVLWLIIDWWVESKRLYLVEVGILWLIHHPFRFTLSINSNGGMSLKVITAGNSFAPWQRQDTSSNLDQYFKTIRKSTQPMCSGSARSVPKSSKLAACSWSISDLFISTHLKVLPRWVWQLRTCYTRRCFQVTSNSVLFSYKKYANLVAPKTEEKVSTKCFYCEVSCCKGSSINPTNFLA